MPPERAFSRRKFLAFLAAAGALSAFEAACRASGVNIQEWSTPRALSSATPLAAAKPVASPVPVGLVEHGDLAHRVRRAVQLAGGFQGLKPDATVFIKPNIMSFTSFPETTNPEVIRAVIELVKEYQPKRIVVGDRTMFLRPTDEAMKRTGIYDAVVRAGAEAIALENEPWSYVRPRNATGWSDGFKVADLLLKADYVIYIPVIKSHNQANFTMALKNSVGITHPESRQFMHSHEGKPDEFQRLIAEISVARPPDFVILDGTRIIVQDGPYANGPTVTSDLIVATKDIIAAEVTGLSVLKSLGTSRIIADTSPWTQPQIARAVQLGLGVNDASLIQLNHESVRRALPVQHYLV